MKENGRDEPDPTICIVPLYSAPKIAAGFAFTNDPRSKNSGHQLELA